MGTGTGTGTVAAWDIGQDPKCPASTRAELDACLLDKGPYPGEVSNVDKAMGDRLGLVRAGNGQGAEIYVVAKLGDRWRAIKEVFYEQGHGKASGSLEGVAVTDAPPITRVDYTTSWDEPGETVKAQASLACTWPASGEPTCQSYRTRCEVSHDGGKPTVATATLAIAGDKITYTVTANAPNTSCDLAAAKP